MSSTEPIEKSIAPEFRGATPVHAHWIGATAVALTVAAGMLVMLGDLSWTLSWLLVLALAAAAGLIVPAWVRRFFANLHGSSAYLASNRASEPQSCQPLRRSSILLPILVSSALAFAWVLWSARTPGPHQEPFLPRLHQTQVQVMPPMPVSHVLIVAPNAAWRTELPPDAIRSARSNDAPEVDQNGTLTMIEGAAEPSVDHSTESESGVIEKLLSMLSRSETDEPVVVPRGGRESRD